MSNEYVVKESPLFNIRIERKVYLAKVRYYSNGDCDIELDDDEATSDVYDAAWEKAEKLGLIAEHGSSFDAPNYGDNL